MDYDKLIKAIEFFGLKGKISIKSFRRLYKKKSKELHPDIGGDEEQMQKLNEYYKVIVEYLESYEIPVTRESIMKSSPDAFVYFQYYRKGGDKDDRIGF
ncbi:MAG: hypothetical protein N2712_03410 [Brevinematales bacterium]|nr:hypothetical protein [Brevinematales bacterium]